MKRCPKCGCKSFYVTAHVTQDWKVDCNGDFIECIDDCVETTHKPDDDDMWECANCGYNAAGSEFNIKPIQYTDFCDDEEKMRDFKALTKDEFLESYSYLVEEEYDLTAEKVKECIQMTREEFNTKVMEQYKIFETMEMCKSSTQIFADAYEIAKMTSLKDYLTETDDEQIEKCYPYADTILGELYGYEFNYDTPQWTEWEDISYMINEFVKEKEDE